tara:strand:- start:69 stop:257 length:189 start_codon:yes stop_codon:yes gene_type:complete
MEDYVDLNTEQYRKFSAYVMQFNSTNDNKIDYETLFTKKQSFKIRLLNKNKSFMDTILLDMG